MKASGNVSNLVNSFKKQNNCILILDVIINKHIVKITNDPNFFPGPKILWTKSSNIGDALINLTTRRTYKEHNNDINLYDLHKRNLMQSYTWKNVNPDK